jgi:hypothetical protein
MHARLELERFGAAVAVARWTTRVNVTTSIHVKLPSYLRQASFGSHK